MKMSQWLESLRKHALLACCSAIAVAGLMVGNLAAEDSKESSDSSSSSSKSDDEKSEKSDKSSAKKDSSHDESADSSDEADDSSSHSSDQQRAAERARTVERQQNARQPNSAQRQRSDRQQASGRQQGSERQQASDQQGSDRQQQWQRGGSDQNASSGRTSRQQSNWRGQQVQQGNQDQQGQQRVDSRSLGLSLEADDDDTLRVGRVSSQSPARQAGLREDDAIVSVNGREVSSQRDFDRAVSNSQGRRLSIVIDRDGEHRTVQLSTNQLAQNNSGRSYSYEDQQSERGQSSQAFLGVVLDDQYPNMAVVRQVYPQSPAAQAGLRAGDTITALNGERVRSPHELSDEVAQLEPGASIQLQFSRPQSRSVEIRLAARSYTGGQESREQQRNELRTSRSGNQDQDDDDSDRDSRNRSQDRDDEYGRD